MRLHTFIREEMDPILKEWDAFAHSLLPESTVMSDLALRDHAREVLIAIAEDIETHQSSSAQRDKSLGLGQAIHARNTPASIHGTLRHECDFSLIQLAAEFRALRASVLRLWLPTFDTLSPESVDSMVRFNEAIDQALAESIAAFAHRADIARELFLGILGHDLRAPIATMMVSGALLARHQLDSERAAATGVRIERSAKLMSSLVEDLVGYTRVQMGIGLPIKLETADLADVCTAALVDARALHPNARFRLEISGSLTGSFDTVLITQLVTNLLKNAGQHGEAEHEILLTATSEQDGIRIEVNNKGSTIPAQSLEEIFQPLVRLPPQDLDAQPRTSMGLGLYVARQAAAAHGGSISVASSDAEGTTFTVLLPRDSQAS